MSTDMWIAIASYGSTPFAILAGASLVIRSLLQGIAIIIAAWKGK